MGVAILIAVLALLGVLVASSVKIVGQAEVLVIERLGRLVGDELHQGADLRVPEFFRFVLRWVTPLFLTVLLGITGGVLDVARRLGAAVATNDRNLAVQARGFHRRGARPNTRRRGADQGAEQHEGA